MSRSSLERATQEQIKHLFEDSSTESEASSPEAKKPAARTLVTTDVPTTVVTPVQPPPRRSPRSAVKRKNFEDEEKREDERVATTVSTERDLSMIERVTTRSQSARAQMPYAMRSRTRNTLQKGGGWI